MNQPGDNPYEAPAAFPAGEPNGEARFLHWKQLRAALRSNERCIRAWFTVTVVSFIISPIFACSCIGFTWREDWKVQWPFYSLLGLAGVSFVIAASYTFRSVSLKHRLKLLEEEGGQSSASLPAA